MKFKPGDVLQLIDKDYPSQPFVVIKELVTSRHITGNGSYALTIYYEDKTAISEEICPIIDSEWELAPRAAQIFYGGV